MSILDFIPRIEKELQNHIDWAVEWSEYRLTRERARELVWNYWLLDDRTRVSIFSKAYREYLNENSSLRQEYELCDCV